MDSIFLPVSGASEIGASCYFVKLEGTNLLLDCGARVRETISFPNYNILLKDVLDDFSQLDAIVITHAHYDHIGSLHTIAMQAPRTKIFASKITKELIRLQLVAFERCIHPRDNERMKQRKLQMVSEIIDGIIELPVRTSYTIKNCKITLLPAGHMAGACMVALESPNKKVLYTGDFSFYTIADMNTMKTDGFHPDTLILNATHGYSASQSYQEAKGFDYKALEKKINTILRQERNVLLKSSSIPKHLDLFYAIQLMKSKVPYYLDRWSGKVAEAFAELNYHVYSSSMKSSQGEKEYPHVLISNYEVPGYDIINIDYYSLHASFQELLSMVYMCMPKKVFVVHTEVDESCYNFMDELENGGRYQGEILQCFNEEMYHF